MSLAARRRRQSSGSDQATPLLTISSLDVVWVQADAYEQDLGLISEGDTVAIQVPAYPGEKFPGRVGHIGDNRGLDVPTLAPIWLATDDETALALTNLNVAQHFVELTLVDDRGDLAGRVFGRPLAQRLRAAGHPG